MSKLKGTRRCIILVGLLVFLAPVLVVAARTVSKMATKVVDLDPAAGEGSRVLGGPPETATMRSGYVVLEPSKSVGKHSTETYEEAVVVFAGVGEMRLSNGSVLKLKPYVVVYCPPDTEHDVVNTGSEPLRYVYVVAKAR